MLFVVPYAFEAISISDPRLGAVSCQGAVQEKSSLHHLHIWEELGNWGATIKITQAVQFGLGCTDRQGVQESSPPESLKARLHLGQETEWKQVCD